MAVTWVAWTVDMTAGMMAVSRVGQLVVERVGRSVVMWVAMRAELMAEGTRGSKADMGPHSGEIARNRVTTPFPTMDRFWASFRIFRRKGGPTRRFIPPRGVLSVRFLEELKMKKNAWRLFKAKECLCVLIHLFLKVVCE